MKVEFYSNNNNPEKFWDETIGILVKNEAQNAILIKNAAKFRNELGADDWFCATVKDIFGNILTSAMCTPPWNIVVYETSNKHDEKAINLLAKKLFQEGYILPGVTGEKITAELFAGSYAKFIKKDTKVHITLNAMQLDKLSDNIDFAPGYLREITEDDLNFLPYWTNAFAVDCGLRVDDIVNSHEHFKKQVGKSIDYVWVDKIPVSMAGAVGLMPNGAKISRVYTPPFYRNKNYSTSCVWHLSKLLLDQGQKFVSLFADADYPVSNKVYQKVGYRNVCLYQEIQFE